MDDIITTGVPTAWDIFEQFTVVPGRPQTAVKPQDALLQVYASSRAGRIDLIPSRLELSQTPSSTFRQGAASETSNQRR